MTTLAPPAVPPASESIRAPIAALRPDWLPEGGPDWIEVRRRWHVGQLAAYRRTRRALRDARGGDFEGLAEDVELAASELLRIIEVIVADLRASDEPIADQIPSSDCMVARVRGLLRPVDDEVACGEGERPMPADRMQLRAIGGGQAASVSTGAPRGAHNERREGSEA